MRGGKLPRGYTIIEVMIVLAVTGLMFVMAATLISGKQQSTAFTQGVNDMASRLQATIQEVSDGHYSDQQLNCVATGTPPVLSFPSGTLNKQGSNSGCVFLGKFMYFGVDIPNSKYEVFTIADATASQDYASTTMVAPLLSTVDLTTQEIIPQGLIFKGETVTNADGSTLSSNQYGLGFVQGKGSSAANGYQSSSLVYTPNLVANPGLGESAAAGAINGKLVAAYGANICLSDGGSRIATIAIGSNNAALTVDVRMGVSNC